MAEYEWVVLSNTTLGTLMASLDGNIVLIAPGTSLFDLLVYYLSTLLLLVAIIPSVMRGKASGYSHASEKGTSGGPRSGARISP